MLHLFFITCRSRTAFSSANAQFCRHKLRKNKRQTDVGVFTFANAKLAITDQKFSIRCSPLSDRLKKRPKENGLFAVCYKSERRSLLISKQYFVIADRTRTRLKIFYRKCSFSIYRKIRAAYAAKIEVRHIRVYTSSKSFFPSKFNFDHVNYDTLPTRNVVAYISENSDSCIEYIYILYIKVLYTYRLFTARTAFTN